MHLQQMPLCAANSTWQRHSLFPSAITHHYSMFLLFIYSIIYLKKKKKTRYKNIFDITSFFVFVLFC